MRGPDPNTSKVCAQSPETPRVVGSYEIQRAFHLFQSDGQFGPIWKEDADFKPADMVRATEEEP
jgi:hypothetical protein